MKVLKIVYLPRSAGAGTSTGARQGRSDGRRDGGAPRTPPPGCRHSRLRGRQDFSARPIPPCAPSGLRRGITEFGNVDYYQEVALIDFGNDVGTSTSES